MYADHDHRGEYAGERHDHDNDYAEEHHRHYDDERAIEALRNELKIVRDALIEYERDLADARARIRALEADTPHARQLQLEADQAVADLAESGYDRYDEPEPEEYDPGPEVDDEGGMGEYRYILPEDYQRGQS